MTITELMATCPFEHKPWGPYWRIVVNGHVVFVHFADPEKITNPAEFWQHMERTWK